MTAFAVGDRVRVRDSVPDGNPRTPGYLRGRAGVIVRSYGVVVNPLDHHAPYPPLHSVVFPLGEGVTDPHAEVLADLHDDWLERAE